MRYLLLAAIALSSAVSAQPRIDIDLGGPRSSDGEFYVVFISRLSEQTTGNPFGLPGHAYVAFLAEDRRSRQSIQDASGFTCQGNDTCWTSVLRSLPGELVREAMRPSDPSTTARFAVRVTSRDWDRARNRRVRWGRENYELLSRDCVTYAADVARTIGLSVPDRRVSGSYSSSSTTPWGFIRALGRANSGAGGNRTPPPSAGSPDLRPAVSVSRSGPAGGEVAVSYQIRNTGRGESRASSARLRISQSSQRPSSSDPVLSEIRVPALRPGDRQRDRITARLPSSLASGTYYVWLTADVNSDAGQSSSDEQNDYASDRIRITGNSSGSGDRDRGNGRDDDRGDRGGTPDLRPGVSVQSRATAGDRVTVSVQVLNSGRGQSRASSARLRLSQNSQRPSSGDPVLAEIRVPALQPGDRHRTRETVQLPAALASGTYYVWLTADVDSDAGQTSSDERNDYDSDRIRVTASSSGSGSGNSGTGDSGRGGTPDLDPRVSAPSSATAGDQIRVSVRIENDGRGPSRPSLARVRLSGDSRRPSTSDPVLAEIRVPALSPRESHRTEERVQLPASLRDGTYYVWLTADVGSDAGQTSSDERNDYASDRIRIAARASGGNDDDDRNDSGGGSDAGAPDLDPRISAPSSATAGERVRLSLRIENDGGGTSRPSRARVRISQDSRRPSMSDPILAEVRVPALSRGETHRTDETVELPRNLRDGTYYVWLTADVDSDAGQTRSGESNDYASDRIRISAASSGSGSGNSDQGGSSGGGTPDLDPRVSAPSSATAGDRIRVSARIENEGRGRSRPSRARIRISQDSRRPSSSDPILAEIRVPALDPGETHRVEERVELPSGLRDGTYYVWLTADVDSDAGQTSSDERNDYDSDRIRIEARSSGSDRGGSSGSGSGSGTPDLRPSVSAPSSADAGDRIEVRVTIRNPGRGRSRPSSARVRISESSRRPSTSDPLLATVSVPAIDPGERHRVEERVRLPSGLRPGTYYIWLTADVNSDAGQTRSDESNDYDSDRIRIR